MELDYEMLSKKALDFWSNYDNKIVKKKDLTSFFSASELATLLLDLKFLHKYSLSLIPFRSKIIKELKENNKNDNDTLFNKTDVKNLILLSKENKIELSYVFDFCSDEVLLSLLEDSFFKDNYNEIINQLKSDESKIKALDIIHDKNLKGIIVRSIESDSIKLKYLNKVSKTERKSVIASLNSDKEKLRYLNFFTRNKELIISSISSDELKEKLLHQYSLSSKEKSIIVSSFKDEKIIKKYIALLDEETIIDLLEKDISNNLIKELLDKVKISDNNCSHIFSILFDKDEKLLLNFYYSLDPFYRELVLMEDLNGNMNPSLLFKLYGGLEDYSMAYDYINLGEPLPKYCDDYKYLIDNYGFDNTHHSSDDKIRFKYHLLDFVRKYSLDVLRYLDNPNVVEFFYSKDYVFYKILELFNKEESKLNEDNINDLLNAYLQRLFKNNNIGILSLNTTMLNYVNSNDKVSFDNYLKEMSKLIDIDLELSNNNMNRDDFFASLKNMNQKSIDLLKELVNKYITSSRNEFVKNNYEEYLNKMVERSFNKKSLMKYMIKNYPSELIVKYFEGKLISFENIDFDLKEKELLNNLELIKKIIDFRKNPKKYLLDGNKPQLDISRNISVFDSLFEKIVVKLPISSFPDIDVKKDGFISSEVDGLLLCEIIKNLNSDVLNLDLFGKDNVYEDLKEFWFKYKIGSWDRDMYSFFETIGVSVNPEIIANLIENFGLINKNEKLTILGALESSRCMTSSSSKYSLLFDSANFNLLVSDPSPNTSFKLTKEGRINTALKFVKTIRSRKYVTVPAMDEVYELPNSKSINVVVGNFSNMMNLTYGERTLTCYRFGSNADSLLRYVLDNENGFNVRFTDPKTQMFVGRVAGFRNGNSVFLDTLYCRGKDYNVEDLLISCKMLAESLIESTKDSLLPIENVFLVEDEKLERFKYPTIDNKKIVLSKFNPMRVYTDYDKRGKSIILATSEENKLYAQMKLNVSDTPRYSVLRDKVNSYNGINASQRLSGLKILDSFLSGTSIDNISVSREENVSFCISGEDWCLYVDENNELKSFVMKNSSNRKQALEEMKAHVDYFKDELSKDVDDLEKMVL